ncbi:MAG TPA: hypothetical protein EYG65_08840, partial [Rhodospirillales bacterium]|nr:hypothetical protein [Rhodospirillales bacterium]
MVNKKLIWPSTLHHLCLATKNLSGVTRWYQNVMGLSPQILADNLVWLSGSQRNMLLTRGTPGTLRFAAFSAHDDKHLKNIKAHLIAQKLHLKKLSSPLFKNSCFAFVDPDGNNILLGLP